MGNILTSSPKTNVVTPVQKDKCPKYKCPEYKCPKCVDYFPEKDKQKAQQPKQESSSVI
jgi:hypothetical protein